MGLKKQLLLATLLASSCLLSTQVVKADQADVAQANLSQNTESAQATPVTQNTTDESSTNTDKVTADSSQTTATQTQVQSQTQVQAQNQGQNQAQVQANQTTPTQTHTDEHVEGVYTTSNQVVMLYTGDGTQVKNRALAGGTDWYTNARRTLGDGSQYYHVATNEYAPLALGSFKSYVQPYQGTATVVYKAGSSIHDFQGYGSKATYIGNDLPTGSNWKINNRAQIGGKDWYQIGGDTWVPSDYVVVNDTQYKSAAWIKGVPLIAQRPELPNGCEITAVTMMLQYAGAKVDKMQMAREMPRSSDPNYGYIGQPWDQTGITIFPPALMNLVEKYAGSAKNLTGQNFNAIKYQINLGHPVVTWNTLYGFPYHALVVTGYDANYVYYNDCWTDQTLQMGINQFINNWNTQKRRAISY